MSHPLFGPEVRLMLAEGDAAEMKTFCETLHPATVAETLTGDFEPEEVWQVLETTSIRDQADIFEYFPIGTQVKLVQGTGRPHVARLIEQMSHDDRSRLLRRLPTPVAEAILRLVDEADRRDIAALAKYPEGTVGAIMTTDYAWLPPGLRAPEAVERLRQQAPNTETIYVVYVLDEATRKLLGVVGLRDLILAPRTASVRDLMNEEVQTLRATDDRERAAKELARYDFLAMAVVDDDGRLVGIVTHDDVIDVVVQEATEDVHMMGAVQPLTENYLDAPFLTIWRKRAFWLACLFGAELFTFTALSHFEDEIGKLVVLSLFVPLCISTGGNSGSQAATLITRAMALGQLTVGNWVKVLRHELAIGLVLGLTLGVIAFFRGAATPEDIRGGEKEQDEPFSVRVAPDVDLSALVRDNGALDLPPGAEMVLDAKDFRHVHLPKGERPVKVAEGEFRFPARTTLRQEPVNRWSLAEVIALAVMGICLWGTIVGSMLPLVFKRMGVDPGIASSPFVATFVDVTGIIIYFTIAKAFLL
ncbi:MAG TPA: magnesium transporter [Gemmataceae bacterium]|nr:magnesium transporter [Gemmataceae bacterium]